MQDVLVQRLQDLGATIEIREAPPSPGKVVIARFEGKGERSILLMDHYDTVFSPGDAQKRPFNRGSIYDHDDIAFGETSAIGNEDAALLRELHLRRRLRG